jgi:hypothetical protein
MLDHKDWHAYANSKQITQAILVEGTHIKTQPLIPINRIMINNDI